MSSWILAALAVLAGAGAAEAQRALPEGLRGDARALSERKQAETDVAPCPYADAKRCRCAYDRRKRRLKVVIYYHNGFTKSEFSNDLEFMASYALSLRDVELAAPPENDEHTGGNQLFTYPDPALFEGKTDERGKKLEWRPRAIDDFIDLCQVVRKAMAAKTFPGYMPVFFVAMGQSLRKQIGTDVAGEFFAGDSLSKRCSEGVGEAGVPAGPIAFVNMTPDDESTKQVFMHELGHAIGASVGKREVFADRYPGPDKTPIANIMASQQPITRYQDMQMTQAQVAALCASPYLE